MIRRSCILLVAVGLTGATATVAGSESFAEAGTSRAATPTAARPTPNATARAHGIGTAYGAVPGWRSKKLVATRTTVGKGQTVRSASTSSGLFGIDVSSYNGSVNWKSFPTLRFAYVKATEGTYYRSSWWASQTATARAAGAYVGAYHFANPKSTTGAAQADYFIANGGGWAPGKLPGVVDLEWNPYSGTDCYNRTQSQMVAWISAFQSRYLARTGTYPVIYTAPLWWNKCVGTGAAAAVLSARSPLWHATLNNKLGSLPANWASQRIWQYAAVSGVDYDRFNGNLNMLAAMATTGR